MVKGINGVARGKAWGPYVPSLSDKKKKKGGILIVFSGNLITLNAPPLPKKMYHALKKINKKLSL